VDKQGRQIQAKMSISFVVRAREMSLLSEGNQFLSSLWIFILGLCHFYFGFCHFFVIFILGFSHFYFGFLSFFCSHIRRI
jgi:hypothetical protein